MEIAALFWATLTFVVWTKFYKI